DPEHRRFKQVTPEETTLYFSAFGVSAELVVSGSSKWNEYLSVGNVAVGMRFNFIDTETVATYYFHTDNLGSIVAISDETGAVTPPLLVRRLGQAAHPRRHGGSDQQPGEPDPARLHGAGATLHRQPLAPQRPGLRLAARAHDQPRSDRARRHERPSVEPLLL